MPTNSPLNQPEESTPIFTEADFVPDTENDSDLNQGALPASRQLSEDAVARFKNESQYNRIDIGKLQNMKRGDLRILSVEALVEPIHRNPFQRERDQSILNLLNPSKAVLTPLLVNSLSNGKYGYILGARVEEEGENLELRLKLDELDQMLSVNFPDLPKPIVIPLSPRDFEKIAPLALDEGKRNQYLQTLEVSEGQSQLQALQLVCLAIEMPGSDMHIELQSDGTFRVRVRVDGVLQYVMQSEDKNKTAQDKSGEGKRETGETNFVFSEEADASGELRSSKGHSKLTPLVLSPETAKKISSIFMTLADNMLPERRRVIQDGGINFTEDFFQQHENQFHELAKLKKQLLGKNLRISALPMEQGRMNLCLRILGSKTVNSLNDIDMSKELRKGILATIDSPLGIFLVTGATGSGKSTTLTGIISEIKSDEKKILTVENPVEQKIDGITQLSVRESRSERDPGVTFAGALRAFLRHDPDIILVGEMRDNETAVAAIEAAKTGHVVFSTLHSNNAQSTSQRLRDFPGVHAADLQDCLIGVLAQSLVRVCCPDCVTTKDFRDEFNEFFEFETPLTEELILSHPTGMVDGQPCGSCRGIGYKGRMMVGELLEITPTIQDLLGIKDVSASAILEAALKEGFVPKAVDGMRHVISGKTTLLEVKRWASSQRELQRYRGLIYNLLTQKR